MTDDSKSVSYRAEKELCGIFTDVINRLETIEHELGYPVHNYPDKIEGIDDAWWYYELPKEIDCNDGDFTFRTEWLDIDLRKYFNDLKARRIDNIKCTIASVESSLRVHRSDLENIGELRFEDIGL